MYSDKWVFNENFRKIPQMHFNDNIDIQYWLNSDNILVGVCIDFELADDVHYELTATNWFKFLEKVLRISCEKNVSVELAHFFQSNSSHFYFSEILNKYGIEFKKIYF